MIPIDIRGSSNLPVRRNAGHKPLSRDVKPVHDPRAYNTLRGILP